jgi:hypothetical protein
MYACADAVGILMQRLRRLFSTPKRADGPWSYAGAAMHGPSCGVRTTTKLVVAEISAK